LDAAEVVEGVEVKGQLEMTNDKAQMTKELQIGNDKGQGMGGVGLWKR
jgi:hypothetical protein